MTSAARRLLEEALRLSSDEREELVAALSSSLESSELSAEWRDEIERRLARLDAGEAATIDADEHLRRLRAKYAV